MNRTHDAFNISFEPEETPREEEEEEEVVIESMIKNNKVHLLYDAMGEPMPVKKERAPPKTKPKTRAAREETRTIHTLFEYMKPDFLNQMRLDYGEIYETFSERARPLLRELDEDKELILEIIETFVSRMVLDLITQDKVAVKVRTEMVDRIQALYDHRDGRPVLGVKNNFANTDYVNACISERCKEASDPATDPIDARFSTHKRRGRHPKTKVEEAINEIQAIAGEYIAKRLGILQAATLAHNNAVALGGPGTSESPQSSESDGSPTSSSNSSSGSTSSAATNASQKAGGIDYYPIFQQTLETYNRCIPKQNNHGFYIKTLLHLIRTLDSRDWPLHGLMKMVNNLNYCVHAETVKLRFDRSKKRFYSCYSGRELMNNETVTCIRVVENDAERLKEWRENPVLMGRPFEAPEFTRSIGAFYLEKELCCPSTLFYTPLTEGYKSHFPEYFAHEAPKQPHPVLLEKAGLSSSAAKKRRVIKQKRKLMDPLPSVEEYKEQPALKKAKTEGSRIVLTDVKCDDDDCLFESLAKYATATPSRPEQPNLRYCMASLMHCVEVTGSWYTAEEEQAGLRERYMREKREMHQVLDTITKKTFGDEIKRVVSRTLVSLGAEVEHCYGVLLDFVEALIMPDKKLSKFGLHQTNVAVRSLLHESRRRARARTDKEENPLTQVKCMREMACSEWFRACPLLYMILFDYMVKHDEDGLLKEPYGEYLNCIWRHTT